MITTEPGERPGYWLQARKDLSFNDRLLSQVIANYGEDDFMSSRGDPFTTLFRSIVGQQISVKAADAIWARVTGVLPEMGPRETLAAGAAALRGCGLSGKKVEYAMTLAESFREQAWVDRLPSLGDEEVIGELVRLPGLGRWTAEMFLMFCLLRPNVLPVGDVGLLRAMSNMYHDGQPLSAEEARAVGRRWEPWRSVATWFLWRSLDPVPVSY